MLKLIEMPANLDLDNSMGQIKYMNALNIEDKHKETKVIEKIFIELEPLEQRLQRIGKYQFFMRYVILPSLGTLFLAIAELTSNMYQDVFFNDSNKLFAVVQYSFLGIIKTFCYHYKFVMGCERLKQKIHTKFLDLVVTLLISAISFIFSLCIQVSPKFQLQFIVLAVITPFVEMSLDVFQWYLEERQFLVFSIFCVAGWVRYFFESFAFLVCPKAETSIRTLIGFLAEYTYILVQTYIANNVKQIPWVTMKTVKQELFVTKKHFLQQWDCLQKSLIPLIIGFLNNSTVYITALICIQLKAFDGKYISNFIYVFALNIYFLDYFNTPILTAYKLVYCQLKEKFTTSIFMLIFFLLSAGLNIGVTILLWGTFKVAGYVYPYNDLLYVFQFVVLYAKNMTAFLVTGDCVLNRRYWMILQLISQISAEIIIYCKKSDLENANALYQLIAFVSISNLIYIIIVCICRIVEIKRTKSTMRPKTFMQIMQELEK